MFRHRLVALLCVALFVPLLSLDAGTAATGASTPTSTSSMPKPGVARCDSLVTTPVHHDCLLPWPNDAFTRPASTPTGRMVSIAKSATPKNNKGVHIDPTYQNQNDGFSPGSMIMIHVPYLSMSNSAIATSTDIGSSTCSADGVGAASTAPIVLWDTTSKTCVPYFAELDAQDSKASSQLLMIHPVRNFTEGDRIDVVLKNLKDIKNQDIAELPGEAAAVSGTMQPAARGQHLDWIVTHDLSSFDLGHLYVAWDFTVISSGGTTTGNYSAHTLADPSLTMRHQAFAQVGTTAPVFTVTHTAVKGTELQITGRYQVPTFLSGCPSIRSAVYHSTNTSACGSMRLDSSGLPQVLVSSHTKGVWTHQIWANFICVLPTAIQNATPALPTLYGHGLLGDATEVAGGSFVKGVAHNMMGCATDWSGMSSNDILLVGRSLQEMSNFHTNVDHMLQGFVNFQFLARLVNSPRGFASSPAFQQSSAPRFQVGKCQFQGYSEGGIMGGALTAISNQWTRAVLGVPGENYGGLLLNRSVDWSEFSAVYDPSYPNSTDQQVGLQLAQMLWDRGENDGYAEHLTSHPYAGGRAKQVFIIENYGDHQVANVSAESFARTIGAVNHQPVFDPTAFGANQSNLPVTIQWGMKSADQTVANPAFIELWDYGTPTPPAGNLAPSGSQFGSDPHGYGRQSVGLIDQIANFIGTGYVQDVCNAGPCIGVPGA